MSDSGSVRVTRLSRHDVLDTRRTFVAASGLQLSFLEQLEQRDGHEAVVAWLEDHNFWDLADNWSTWSYLLGE